MPAAALLLVAPAAAAAAAALPPQAFREIAPGVRMPTVSLGTGPATSDPAAGVPGWLAAGGVGIDCAFSYSNQGAVAAAVAASGVPRRRLFLTTKVPGIGDPVAKLRADLTQLNTSYADLTLLHLPTDVAAQWAGLEEALARNLTRAIGVSNFNADQLAALAATARVMPAVNQCSMGVGAHDDAAMRWCRARGVTYEAFGAMRLCNFTDPAVAAAARAHGATPAQVCLRYPIDRGCVAAVGTGRDAARAAAYAREDLGVFAFRLTPAEVARLDALAPPPAPPRGPGP